MSIAPVSFCGKAEILGYANSAKKLSENEKDLVKAACDFHDLEVDSTSDGVYVANTDKAESVTERYLESLDKAGASKLSYMIALDTLKAPILGATFAPISRNNLVKKSLDIAVKADDVTKKDITSNFALLANKYLY